MSEALGGGSGSFVAEPRCHEGGGFSGFLLLSPRLAAFSSGVGLIPRPLVFCAELS